MDDNESMDVTGAMDDIAATAREAVEVGAEYLRGEFTAANTAAEYGPTDVKAAVDRGAESRMLEVIESAHPDHAVYGEESGDRGADPADAPYRWIVDPLDGTNNFCAGLPTFASGVAVLDAEAGDAAVAAVAVPMLEDTYLAVRGEGVTYNGTPASAESDVGLANGTLAFVIGRDVVESPARREAADAVQAAMAGTCKRVVDSWAPLVHWALLARGMLEGVVSYHPDIEEQPAGELLAAESGAETWSAGGVYVAGVDGAVTESLVDAIEPHLEG